MAIKGTVPASAEAMLAFLKSYENGSMVIEAVTPSGLKTQKYSFLRGGGVKKFSHYKSKSQEKIDRTVARILPRLEYALKQTDDATLKSSLISAAHAKLGDVAGGQIEGLTRTYRVSLAAPAPAPSAPRSSRRARQVPRPVTTGMPTASMVRRTVAQAPPTGGGVAPRVKRSSVTGSRGREMAGGEQAAAAAITAVREIREVIPGLAEHCRVYNPRDTAQRDKLEAALGLIRETNPTFLPREKYESARSVQIGPDYAMVISPVGDGSFNEHRIKYNYRGNAGVDSKTHVRDVGARLRVAHRKVLGQQCVDN